MSEPMELISCTPDPASGVLRLDYEYPNDVLWAHFVDGRLQRSPCIDPARFARLVDRASDPELGIDLEMFFSRLGVNDDERARWEAASTVSVTAADVPRTRPAVRRLLSRARRACAAARAPTMRAWVESALF